MIVCYYVMFKVYQRVKIILYINCITRFYVISVYEVIVIYLS